MKKTTSKTHSISRIVPVIIAVLVCVSVSGLAGCGSSKQDQSAGDSSAESAEASSAEIQDQSTEDSSAESAEASSADIQDQSAEDSPAESTETSSADIQDQSAEDSPAESAEASSADTQDQAAAGIRHAEIVIKDYGTIKLELDAEAAPITVENFVNLANDGFYDGLTFHRIIDGFMIQGGDPNGNGTGGSDKNIKGEFSENGVDNPISHKPGVISMARAQDPDSASSQFFITVADASFLDGQYAAFGHVTEGMDVAEQIAKDAKPVDGNGTVRPEEQPVIETIRILD